MAHGTLEDLINTMTLVTTTWIFWGGILFSLFLAGAQIIWTSGNAEKRKQAGPRLLWAVIAFFVVVSIGGIVAVLNATLLGSPSSLSTQSPSQTTTGANGVVGANGSQPISGSSYPPPGSGTSNSPGSSNPGPSGPTPNNPFGAHGPIPEPNN